MRSSRTESGLHLRVEVGERLQRDMLQTQIAR
jgi:hypothetical protein